MNRQYQQYADTRLGGGFGEMSSWRLVRPYLDCKRILDVGCSDGLYLKQMSGESMGIEQVPALGEKGRGLGLKIISGDVLDVIRGLQDGTFEGVLFSHVMEHVDAPIEMLRQISRVLERGGVLVLGLPIERNIFRDLLRMDYFDGTHIYAFSIRNAEKLLRDTGFKVERVFFHLPRCRGRLGRASESAWNWLPLPRAFRSYFSMAYWIVAIKQ